jgi:MFS transporter, SP family, general alpha glucoside:H+ symporter
MEGRRRSSVVEVTRADDGVRRVDDAVIRRMSVANPDIPQIHQEAKNATANEQNMTLREAIRLYPKAIMFSIIFSTAVVMEGYDLSVMNSFYAFTPFKNKYGDQPDPEEGGRLISAQWQTGLGNGVQVCPLVAQSRVCSSTNLFARSVRSLGCT